jgi:hypothetical protein
MMKLKFGAALLAAVAALTIGTGPASAESAHTWGCFAQGGSLLFTLDGSPNEASWQADYDDCRAIDKVGTHVKPLTG